MDTGSGIITEATNTYPYSFEGTEDAYNITVNYPNGATYSHTQTRAMGNSSWDGPYDITAYPVGDVLVDVATHALFRDSRIRISSAKLIAILVLAAIGVMGIAAPISFGS